MPRRRTSVFEKMFSDNRLRSIPDSEQQSTLCVEYWTSKILIELSGYKSLELDAGDGKYPSGQGVAAGNRKRRFGTLRT